MNPTTEQSDILDAANGTPCIEFEGRRLTKGYGYIDGKLAHRDVWEKANGPIPKGLWVLHKCDNPPCINLEHLFIGTCQDNHNDMIAKGRNPSRVGVNNGRAILTEDDVRDIHLLFMQGMTAPQIAERYFVTAETLRSLKSGFSWKHIYAEFYHGAD